MSGSRTSCKAERRGPSGPLGRALFVWLLVGACLAAAGGGFAGAPAGHRQAAARRAPPALFDRAEYELARGLWAKGELSAAAEAFEGMLRAPAGGEVWTWSVALLCESGGVEGMARSVSGPAPVFLMPVAFKGRDCYRLCSGLERSRSGLLRLGRPRLEDPALRPFPVRLPPPGGGNQAGVPMTEEAAPPHDAQPPAASSEKVPLREILPSEQAARETTAPGEGAGRPPDAGAEAGPRQGAVRQPEGEVWFQKGLQAYQSGRTSEADKDFERALAADPERPEVLNNLGILRLEEKRYAEAEALFRKALAVDPEYARAHLNLAGALWGQRKQAEAVAEARKAAELDPSDVHAHLSLASFYLALGQRPEAEAEAKRVLLLDPGNLQAKAFLAGAPSP
ncbi:MAG: tetratricopeptide repeat protein [Acidobacteriota bacterium]